MIRQGMMSTVVWSVLIVALALAFAGQSGGSEGFGPAGPQRSADPNLVGMIRLVGGSYWMGCVPADGECQEGEKPRHQVTLDPFWLDEHEVTVAEYAQCVEAAVCREPRSTTDIWSEFYNWRRSGREYHPVNGVDWNDAQTYCRWRGKRLPTEAEFEFALRAGADEYIYPWGNRERPPAQYGNYGDESAQRRVPNWKVFAGYDDGYVGTAPACSFPRNTFGLCDISGNVEEWCADWFDPGYYATSPVQNPPGPYQGGQRVVRGGGWSSTPLGIHASSRSAEAVDGWLLSIGFRCSRSVGSSD